ncbi:hypothetical protein RHSIM_Rhsim12G0055700 [Rhododendron simsii]|uniref:Uncharacterized protein n=1 Tax=Rhododendron simsii TaxID=118357 RepID=A0A834G1B1_RHOSS|nr:hypothetical protein RHSIM_Rhsim12G0055700 [Rhododendron simsii]
MPVSKEPGKKGNLRIVRCQVPLKLDRRTKIRSEEGARKKQLSSPIFKLRTVKLGDSVVAPKENEGKESALGDENKGGVDGNGKSSRSKRARKTDSVALPKGNGKEEVGLGKKLKGGKLKDMEVDEVGDFWAMHPCLKEESLEMETETGDAFRFVKEESVRRFLKENMSTIGNKKTMELEKKWKNLHAAEVTLALKRGELMNEQTKLVLDATNASKD